jgi:hypothetical protein
LCEEAAHDPHRSDAELKPGYREATADPASVLVCQRRGALVSDTATNLTRPLPCERRAPGDDTVNHDQELTGAARSREQEQLVAKPPADSIVEALLERHRQTYAQELGIDVAKGTPSALFRLLVASILFSARIGAGQAVKAARALTDEAGQPPTSSPTPPGGSGCGS